jgi:hypothetical protein
MATLYHEIDNVDEVTDIRLTDSHGAAHATCVISCLDHDYQIGDEIEVDFGYEDNHRKQFEGYVKQIDRRVPDNSYAITALSKMIRAVDFFIVGTNPDSPLKFSNIDAEDLIREVLELAGLNSFDMESTNFTLAVTEGVYAEVNLVSSYDYARGIADLVAWHLWCDPSSGTIHFDNRKPYVHRAGSPEDSQPGWDVDPDPTIFLTDANILQFMYSEDERDLRNRIVVAGAPGISAVAEAESPYLPSGFRKSAALYWPILDDQSLADKAASYNLKLLNRLTKRVNCTTLGDPNIEARMVVDVNEAITGIDDVYYVFMIEHMWNKSGYTCSMDLRY